MPNSRTHTPATALFIGLLSALCGPVAAQNMESTQTQPEAAALDLANNHDDDSLMGILDLSNYTFRDFTGYWENDGAGPNFIDDTDRYYTNGNGLELSFDPNLNAALRSRLSAADHWDQDSLRFGAGIALKQRIYTAEDITIDDPPARDHPYAGYLTIALSFQRADDTTHDHFGLDLGVVGHASGSESIQKWIHSTVPDELEPRGWETQLSDEPTINFAYTRTWKTKKAEFSGLELELLPSVGFDAGTVLISARTSMTLRIGKNLPSDFGPAQLLTHKDHTVSFRDSHDADWSVYAYTRIGADAIARDIFIDGNAFAGSRSAEREPLVAIASFGIVARYKSLYLSWSQSIQTERFERQTDDQTWGSIVIGCSFDW